MSTQWVGEIRIALTELLKRREVSPQGDIEWLLLRCGDTVGFEGQWQKQHASLCQLRQEVLKFASRFPGLIPGGLLPETEGE
jgi:hypothetical protein